jgi:hypothetical protein
MKHAKILINFEHYANAMVHPITGCTISSYKKLMHDPVTAKVWQTAFGKDFGGMAHGCNKNGQKGTNGMFVMMHDEIKHALAAIFFTYANPVVDYHPQKDDPHRIWITAGGNFINYKGDAPIWISSYKNLMHDMATAEVWQTAFGKDFGGMAQGCNKTGQKGTNTIFVMTHDDEINMHLLQKPFHLRKSSCWLPPAKGRSSPDLNHSGG